MEALFKITPKTLLIDFSNLVFRTVLVSTGNPCTKQEYLHRFYNTLISLQKKFPGCKTIFVYDTRGGKNKRKETFPEYKGNRGNYIDCIIDTLKFNPIVEFSKLVQTLSCEICVPYEAEADDGIATLCHILPGLKYVVSNDKDMWQLMSSSVTLYTKEVVTIQHVLKSFRITNPLTIPLVKTLCGDPSDNIPSVGIRWQYVKDIIKDCVTITDLFDNIDKINHLKTKEILVNNKELLEIIYKIVLLDQNCKYCLKKFGGNKEKLGQLLGAL